MVILFILQIHSYRKKETSQGDISIGCGIQLV
jgi:hypothetical protein